MMPDKKARIKHKMVAALVISAALLAIAYLVMIQIFQERKELKRTAPNEVLLFSGIDMAQITSARLQMRGQTGALTIGEGHASLTPEQKESFAVPYQMTMSVVTPDEKYQDFSWSLSSSGVEYKFTADGFSPSDTFSLSLNNEVPLKNIPFDWSGRLELPMILIPELDTKVCIRIVQKQKEIDVCHIVLGRPSL